MRVVMLGHSGVGKTTYMAAMYYALHTPMAGFRLKAKERSVHNHLLRVARRMRRGIYPDPTDSMVKYDFRLLLDDVQVMELSWHDFRGGALSESGTNDDTQALMRTLNTAQGILMFVDAVDLVSKGKRNSDLGRLMVVARQAVNDIEFPVPLVVVLSKWDLANGAGAPEKAGFFRRLLYWLRPMPSVQTNRSMITEAREDDRVKSPLAGLTSAMEVNSKLRTALIPTACQHQAFVNSHLPTLFALRAGAEAIQARLEMQRRERIEAADRLEQQSGVLNAVASFVTARKSNAKKSRQSRDEARALEVVSGKLSQPMQRLDEYLKEALSI